MRRRAFLRLGLAAGLAVASPAALVPAEAANAGGGGRDEETADLLHELILQRALSRRDPWTEMHVVLALGPRVEGPEGAVLDDAVAQSVRLETAGFRRVPVFPLEIERHPFHFLQVMQTTGVSRDRSFATPAGRFTRGELVAGAEALFSPAKVTDELSWAVSVLTREHPPDHERYRNAAGEEIDVGELVERHIRDAEAAYADTLAAMAGRAPYRRGPIQAKACNGTHLLYGLIDALRAGYRGHELRSRVARLVRATLFRVRMEPLLIDRSLGGADPLSRLNADAAKLTFLGHVLEDLGEVRRHRVLELSDADLQTLAGARSSLAEIVGRLTGEHDLDALARQVPSAYKLILGDSCHAYRGLELWRSEV